jgi:hypothetical protein
VEPGLRDSLRYLELRLAECRGRPDWHRHQIAAYERCLAAARAAPTSAAYLAAPGGPFEIARAEWLDRYAGFAALARALGSELGERAARIDYDAAGAATDPVDLAVRLSREHGRALPLRTAAAMATGAVPHLVIALVDWHAEHQPALRDEHRARARAHVAALQAADPGFDLARLGTHLPYRHRLPFDPEALWSRLAALPFEPAPGPSPPPGPPPATSADRDPTPPVGEVGAPAPAPAVATPTAAEAAAGFHATYAALDPNDPATAPSRRVLERIFALERASDTAPTFLARVAEQNLFCELARARPLQQAKAALDACRGRGQLYLEHHLAGLIRRLEACRSPTEIELELHCAEDMLAVETAWWQVLVHVAFKPVREAIASEHDPSEARRAAVRDSRRLARAVLGCDVAALLAAAPLRALLSAVLFERGQTLTPTPGPSAVLGEVGLDFAQDVRRAAIQHAIAGGMAAAAAAPEAVEAAVAAARAAGPRFATVSALEAHVLALLERAGRVDVDDGRAPAPLSLWGQPVEIEDLADVFTAPPRPPIVLG